MALWGAVVATGASLVLGLGRLPLGARRGRTRAPEAAAPGIAGRTALGLASLAVGALAWSLLTGNFALAYVADTTSRRGGWLYRLAGLWGGNGGSLLLWGWIILLTGFAATRHRPTARLVATVAGGSVLLIAAAAANPFARLAVPAIDGGGLNPILQYPAMLYHPILLYAGHAGLVAPFALAVTGLASRRLDHLWWATIRRWMLGAWLLLGVGLVAGAHWAYVELGWGGFWGWDPVENSGLLPWLAATAFLHAARKSRIDGDRRVPSGMAVLAALPFCLSLLGASISRSGAAQSVHAFAEATAVGQGLLVLLLGAVATAVFAVMRAERGRPSADRGAALPPQSVALIGAVVLLLAVAAAVAVGTVFPVLAHSTTGQTVAVTARYYAIVITPLAVAGVLLMGVAPSLRRRVAANCVVGANESATFDATVAPDGPPSLFARRARWIAAAAAGVVAGGLLVARGAGLSAALGAGAAGAGALTVAQLVVTRRLRRAGALLAHAGIALLLLGVAGSLLGRQSTEVVRPGSALRLDAYTVRYRGVVVDQGSGWQRVRTIVDVERDGRRVAVLSPGLRLFEGQVALLSDVAMHSTLYQDLIVAVRSIDPATHAAQLEVTVRPLVNFVWWGGLLAAAGGAVVLGTTFGFRRLVETPVRATRPYSYTN